MPRAKKTVETVTANTTQPIHKKMVKPVKPIVQTKTIQLASPAGYILIGIAVGLVCYIAFNSFLSPKNLDSILKKENQNLTPQTTKELSTPIASNTGNIPISNAQTAAPISNNINTANTTTAASNVISNTDSLKSQRCIYNGQNYASGDIVKTSQNWVRCTPTITFTQDKPTVPIYSTPEWVLVQ